MARPPMSDAAAKRYVEAFRADLMWCASKLQNDPGRFERALVADHDTYKEFRRLIGDLYSLIEVIIGED